MFTLFSCVHSCNILDSQDLPTGRERHLELIGMDVRDKTNLGAQQEYLL